jgi:hypothetical protein
MSINYFIYLEEQLILLIEGGMLWRAHFGARPAGCPLLHRMSGSSREARSVLLKGTPSEPVLSADAKRQTPRSCHRSAEAWGEVRRTKRLNIAFCPEPHTSSNHPTTYLAPESATPNTATTFPDPSINSSCCPAIFHRFTFPSVFRKSRSASIPPGQAIMVDAIRANVNFSPFNSYPPIIRLHPPDPLARCDAGSRAI